MSLNIKCKTISMLSTMDLAIKNVNSATVSYWLSVCKKDIQNLKKLMKKKTLNVGQKSNLQSTLSKMVGFRTSLKNMKLKFGEKIQIHDRDGFIEDTSAISDKNDKTVKWIDLESCFKGRIKTAVIINLQHRDPVTFLEDCSKQFKVHVKKILNTHKYCKINAVFCAKFIKKVHSNSTDIGLHEQEEFKHIGTKTMLLDNSKILKWFQKNIQNVILRKLEEFQVTFFYNYLNI